MPEYKRMSRYVIDNHGWSSKDEADKPVNPLIFRKGGLAPIDHKVEFESFELNSYFKINIKVPSYGILLMTTITQDSLKDWQSQFIFYLDNSTNININCEMSVFDKLKQFQFDDSACFIQCNPGKHILTIEYVNKDTFDKKYPRASIDMIVGI